MTLSPNLNKEAPKHPSRRSLGGGRMFVPAGRTWCPGDGPMMGYWIVPYPRLENISGGQAWQHLVRIPGQNLGPFRFLSADLTRRSDLGEVVEFP
ncbi:hypothetical protein ACLKA6_005228 [Drosophila palustris]